MVDQQLFCQMKKMLNSLELIPLARIIGYHDSAIDPVDFSKSNTKVINEILSKTKMSLKDINYHEIHETYASIPLVNIKLLNLDLSKINIHGGSISLGHPFGMSGNRIIISLLNILKEKNESIGMASIWNGGGDASAVIIERLN